MKRSLQALVLFLAVPLLAHASERPLVVGLVATDNEAPIVVLVQAHVIDNRWQGSGQLVVGGVDQGEIYLVPWTFGELIFGVSFHNPTSGWYVSVLFTGPFPTVAYSIGNDLLGIAWEGEGMLVLH
jgi:hypothetical protein